MKRFIQQLLEDINNSLHPSYSDEQSKDPIPFYKHMEEIENWATGVNIPPTLYQECGLSPEQFPPVDQLDYDEMESIIEALKNLLASWNMEVELPSEIPVSRAYPLVVNLLNKEAWYLQHGVIHFDFCTGYAPECELQEYCHCRKYWNLETREIMEP